MNLSFRIVFSIDSVLFVSIFVPLTEVFRCTRSNLLFIKMVSSSSSSASSSSSSKSFKIDSTVKDPWPAYGSSNFYKYIGKHRLDHIEAVLLDRLSAATHEILG